MKIKISLISKISIVFVFTFILLVFAFITFSKIAKENSHKNIFEYYLNITKSVKENRLNRNEVKKYLKNFNFLEVDNPHKVLGSIKKQIIRKKGLELINIENIYYLHILTPHFRVLFKDEINRYENNYIPLFIFAIILSLFVFVYILILKNIRDTNLLLNSRQLFLRTVMHELKTPIAKGRIVSELLDDEKQKKRMIVIFEKLDFLINDFAKVEEVISKQYSLNINKYSINTIIEYSIEMLMLDSTKNKIILKFNSNKELYVDLDLFSMAIKNLLDNALKYSTNQQVLIEYNDNELKIISTGNKLPNALEYYYKPFHNDVKSKNHGMGLGLYIVYSILSIHNIKLSYNYQKNINIFTIKLVK